MKIAPLHDQVVVSVIMAQEWRNSKLWVPKTTNFDGHSLLTGEVVAVGPGPESTETARLSGRGPMHVEVGDIVVWPYFQCHFMEINDVKFAVLSDKQIVAKLEGDDLAERLKQAIDKGQGDTTLN